MKTCLPRNKREAARLERCSLWEVDLFELENLLGKVTGKIQEITGGDKELSMKEQDLRIFEKDLNALEIAFPERKDILVKTKLLIKDHIRLKEMLSEENTLKTAPALQNLLLAQVLEYENDRKLRETNLSSAPAARKPNSHPSNPHQDRIENLLNELGENPELHDLLDDTLCALEAKLSKAKFTSQLAAAPKITQSQPMIKQPSNSIPLSQVTKTVAEVPKFTQNSDDDFELDDLDPLVSKPKPAAPIDDIMDIDLEAETLDAKPETDQRDTDNLDSNRSSPTKQGPQAPKSLSSILAKSKKLKPKPAG